jgi:hypothetical protein
MRLRRTRWTPHSYQPARRRMEASCRHGVFREPLDRQRIIAIGCVVLAIAAIAYALTSKFGRQYTDGIAARLSMGGRQCAQPLRRQTAWPRIGSGQADVSLLARLDPATHTIHAITIPRDTATRSSPSRVAKLGAEDQNVVLHGG